MGIKSIATHLNAIGIRTRDGGKWGIDAVHKVLTRTTYVGRHRFNAKFWKTRERKPETEIVEMAVPAIVDKVAFAFGGDGPRLQDQFVLADSTRRRDVFV